MRAGIAAGTIYLYFGDKADLYGSVIVEKMSEVVGRLETALSSERFRQGMPSCSGALPVRLS